MNRLIGNTFSFVHGTRQARFAGSWYERDATELNDQLEGYLRYAQSEQQVDRSKSVLALIVPHAGYSYSGQTAAFAYEKLDGVKVNRVFLLGPSHYTNFRGVALPTQSAFETPLGNLRVDLSVVQELAHFKEFRELKSVHEQEHSLELQLPLIRKTLGDVPIIPLAVGTLEDITEIYTVAGALRHHLKPNDLVIVSSDFTHYGPRFSYQPFHDHFSENIRKLDDQAFKCLHDANLVEFVYFKKETNDTICGFIPCAILLAMLPYGSTGTLLRYRTSQQIAYDSAENSVSYLAVSFSGEKEAGWFPRQSAELDELTEEDGSILLQLARNALLQSLDPERKIDILVLTEDQKRRFAKPYGAFVTLLRKGTVATESKRASGRYLRGCIGYIWPTASLREAVVENAISASSRDPRFKPVEREELDNLIIDVSVLNRPLPIEAPEQIRLGIDGIVMHKDGHQSVFLPHVPTEFGWDLNETLRQLCIKAGLPPDAWTRHALFDTFQAKSFERNVIQE